MRKLIAIDPGNKKCGLLLADIDSDIILDGRVVTPNAVVDLIKYWVANGEVEGILLGNGTTSKYWQKKLHGLSSIKLVEEKGTTLRARSRYWEIWPPPIWLRFLSKGMLVPFQHLDAIAALVLLEDYLNKKFKWPGKTNFKISP